jgi:hypothetical protein
MKKTIIKIIYIIAVFILSIIIISRFNNHQSSDMTAKMSEATLPTLSLLEDGKALATLYGYTQEMDVTHIHGTVFPTGAEREISAIMNLYGQEADNFKFEVRTLDGSSLVESTQITDVSAKSADDTVTLNFQIKDLIDANKEYALIIIADVDGRSVRYISRIVWTADEERYYFDEKLDFVRGFSQTTFDKEKAAQQIKTYLESNSSGDNSSYAKVNINSSFNQVTWGDLEIKSHTEPEVLTVDLHEQTGSFLLKYQVTVGGDKDFTCNVEEYFRIRYTKDRIYLLNYERTMNNIFMGDKSEFDSGAIDLKIADTDNIEFTENEGGSAFAFVSQGRLFSYNVTNNKLAYIFGFYDEASDDPRCTHTDNSIKILNIDEAGNVDFSVAGYMNRGIHEGKVGIAVYYYNASTNTVEEQVFIPSSQSEEIIMAYASKIATLGNSSQFYMILGSDLLAVDLEGRTYEPIIDNMLGCKYEMPESGEMIAWQDVTSRDGLKSISVMNFATQAVTSVEPESGEYIILLGYMDEDLVYGLVREEDIHNDQMGNPVYAMYSIRIQDKEGRILENYKSDGNYTVGTLIKDNQIILSRVKWNESTGFYEDTTQDQIMSTLEVEEGSNTLSYVNTDAYKYTAQISLKNSITASSLKVLTPSLTLYEGSREVAVDNSEETDNNIFFVYYKDKVINITVNSADALTDAYTCKGVVMDDSNDYVWYSGNLLTSNQIMSITNNVEKTDYSSENSTEVCLRAMLEFEGINVDVGKMLEEGYTAEEILKQSLPGATILEYDGCDMNAMLYYLNQDIPVMVRLSDGSSMLLIGFNTQNIVLFNPKKGTTNVYKNGMNDSYSLFEENGNHFLTYLYK